MGKVVNRFRFAGWISVARGVHHREVLAEAWSGFKAKLLDESTLSMTAFIVFADRRRGIQALWWLLRGCPSDFGDVWPVRFQ